MFDLDNTLYPHHVNLWQQVDARIGEFVSAWLKITPEEARAIQKDYYRRYGTTMRGMMTEHGVRADDYLAYVHQIDHSPLQPNPAMGAAIAKLPGRKLILTNGSTDHADKVLAAARHRRRISRRCSTSSPPSWNRSRRRRPTRNSSGLTASIPQTSAMFEDLARNLVVPHQLGMTTVLVVPDGTEEVVREDWELEGRDAAHVDHVTDDLTGFLQKAELGYAMSFVGLGARMQRSVVRDLRRVVASAWITLRSRPDDAILDSPPSNPDKSLPAPAQSAAKEISMSLASLESTVNSAFDARDSVSTATKGEVRDAVDHALELLDKGEARVAEREAGGKWKVNQWLKKAVLLSFRLNDMSAIAGGPGKASWWDKVPSKFDGWGENRFRDAGFRAVPGAIVRRSAFIARNVVLMPSFVNLGAYVDEATMIDTWSTVGSCAQIGKRVHISGGVGIGGVLEPLQAEPVIVEDDCFIGARSEVAEGVIVRKGAVLAMGVFLGASTKIVDRDSGEIFVGEVPEYAVVVPGTLPARPLKNGQPGPSTACAVIVKRVDERTRAKTSINELLRD